MYLAGLTYDISYISELPVAEAGHGANVYFVKVYLSSKFGLVADGGFEPSTPTLAAIVFTISFSALKKVCVCFACFWKTLKV
jgi:hypothetical protein